MGRKWAWINRFSSKIAENFKKNYFFSILCVQFWIFRLYLRKEKIKQLTINILLHEQDRTYQRNR